MIKIGQRYRADKSQIIIEIINQQTQRHAGAKAEWIMRPLVTDEKGEAVPDFPIWKESFEKHIEEGKWILAYDPDAPLPEVGPLRNRLDDIE